MGSDSYNPFKLAIAKKLRSPLKRAAMSAIEPGLERALGLRWLVQTYEDIKANHADEDFVDTTLNKLNVMTVIQRGSLSAIPASGPVVFVANHPFGGLEGVILIQLLREIRSDVRLMANFLLNRIPELRQYFISVDPFDSDSVRRANISGLRESLSWLKTGGCVGMFPSGTVSHLSVGRKDISDPAWSTSAARLARATGATVVPIFFHGTNSLYFQLAGLIHPMLRTMLIPRQFCNKRNQEIKVSIGAPIPPARLAEFGSDQEVTDYLRLRTYILGGRDLLTAGKTPALQPKTISVPVPPAESPEILAAEIRQLPESRKLLTSGAYDVYVASAAEIPHILNEIGRLRELTFRAVQEGTGKPVDIDIFDNFYEHLFVWHRGKCDVVGAYRIGRVDKIMEKVGKTGLYTHTLFLYKDSVLRQLGPALELGRSFIRQEYQRDYGALLNLWQGIGRFVANNPQYRVLFGPVSISAEYDAISRQLIVDFLKVNKLETELSRDIKPRTPLPRFSIRGVGNDQVRVVKNLTDVGELLRELESVHSSVPVLLRQYIKLGAKILGFNLDPNFGDVLDALIYVDLLETERRLRVRYLGKEGSEKFVEYHTRQAANKGTGPNEG